MTILFYFKPRPRDTSDLEFDGLPKKRKLHGKSHSGKLTEEELRKYRKKVQEDEEVLAYLLKQQQAKDKGKLSKPKGFKAKLERVVTEVVGEEEAGKFVAAVENPRIKKNQKLIMILIMLIIIDDEDRYYG